MVEAKDRVESGIRCLLGGRAELTNSDLVVIEVRDPRCKNQFGQATIAEGDCAIIGYLATSQADVRTNKITDAGTAVGLASRLGARDARLQGFELRETSSARSEAMTRAVNDARAQAQVLAAAAGSHLGRVLDIRYNSYNMAEFANRVPTVAAPPPPPPPPPPPVEVNMKPRPEEISADVSVSYELLP